jgi:hypothetical protein
MPVGHGKYRVTTTSSGKKVRLHFGPGGRVNEAKSLSTGKTHTPAEFKQDDLRRTLADQRRQGLFKKRKR